MKSPNIVMFIVTFLMACFLVRKVTGLDFRPTQTRQGYQNTTQSAQITSSPTSFTTYTITETCTPGCAYSNPHYDIASWSPIKWQNVTVATVVVIVDDATNKTLTSTSYVESLLVNGTALSNSARTNSAGTVTATITGVDSSITVLAYPTPWLDYPTTYSWRGKLPFSTANHLACITATGRYTFPSHPPLVSTTIKPPDDNDPGGLHYALMYDERFLSPRSLAAVFSGQLAGTVFSECPEAWGEAPVSAAVYATYLTKTSTSHVSNPIVSLSSSVSTTPASIPAATLSIDPVPKSTSPFPGTSTQGPHKPTPKPFRPSSTVPRLLDPSEAVHATSTASSTANAIIQPGTSPTHVSLLLSSILAFPAIATSPSAQPRNSAAGSNVMDSSSSRSADSRLSTNLSPSKPVKPILSSGLPISISPLTSANSPSQAAYVVTFQSTTMSVEVVQVTELNHNTPSTALALVIGSITALPGESITVEETPIAVSIDDGQTDLMVGSAVLTNLAATPTGAIFSKTHSLDLQIITQSSQTKYLIDGKTLELGSTLTVTAGSAIETVALETANGQTIVVLGDTTTTLGSAPTATGNALPLLTLGANTYAPSQSGYVIAGQTLRPGGSAIEVSGTPLSLMPQGSELVVGGSTTILGTEGLGGVILSDFGGSSPKSTVGARASSAGSADGTGSVTFAGGGRKPVDVFGSLWTAAVALLVVLTLACI